MTDDTPTPRTDALAFFADIAVNQTREVILSDDARQLERELARAKQYLTAERDDIAAERDKLQEDMARVTAERDEAIAAAQSHVDTIVAKTLLKSKGYQLLEAERDQLASEKAALERERDELTKQRDFIWSKTCIHHNDAERAAITCPVCAKADSDRAIDFCIGLTGLTPEKLKAVYAERDALQSQLAEAREQRDEARALLDGIVGQFASLKGGDSPCTTGSEVRPSLSAKPRRKHLVQSAGYWFEASKKAGVSLDAVMAMENAYNHAENALAAALAENEKLRAYIFKQKCTCDDQPPYTEGGWSKELGEMRSPVNAHRIACPRCAALAAQEPKPNTNNS